MTRIQIPITPGSIFQCGISSQNVVTEERKFQMRVFFKYSNANISGVCVWGGGIITKQENVCYGSQMLSDDTPNLWLVEVSMMLN